MVIVRRVLWRLALLALVHGAVSGWLFEALLETAGREVEGAGGAGPLLFPVHLAVVAAAWWLARPIAAALAAPRVQGPSRAAAAARARHLPAAVASLWVALSSAVSLWWAWRVADGGSAVDAAVAGLAVSLGAHVIVAMLAHGAATLALVPVLETFGDMGDPHYHWPVRAKVASVTFGLLLAAILILSGTSYLRYRADTDAAYAAGAAAALESAAAAGGTPQDMLRFVHRATRAPSALIGRGGELLAAEGSFPEPLRNLAARGGGSPTAVPGGWLVARRLGEETWLASFLPEAAMLARRGAFWRSRVEVAIALCLAAAMVVLLAARSLTAPIDSLRRAAGRIAAGDLTVEAPSVSCDEVGELAADFRRIAEGLTPLLSEVKAATEGVSQAAREVNELGGRMRGGVREERRGMKAVDGALQEMQGSIALLGRRVEALTGFVSAANGAVGHMAGALEEVKRQGGELERSMSAAEGDVKGLADAGRTAREALSQLEERAMRAGGTVKEVNATLAALEGAGNDTAQNATRVAEMAEQAGGVVGEAVAGIETLRGAVSDAHARLEALGRRAGDIDQIVDFIGEVAGRTNLLSLNASIIAAQAGEHGKAFAVVADQIRELAWQISSSTKSIGEIISGLREEVDKSSSLISRGDALAGEGLSLARRSVEALSEIQVATARAREMASAIRRSIERHAESSREVSDLVAAVAEGTRMASEAVELVGGSVAGVGALGTGVGAMAEKVGRALEEQSRLGRAQLESLERISAMLRDASIAVEDHGAAARAVRESLATVGKTAEDHEGTVNQLGAVAERLEHRARALADRVGRFKV